MIAAAAPATPGYGPHGVTREYAALAPGPDAVALKPVLDVPLTDASIAMGPDKAFYLTGSEVGSEGARFSPRVVIRRSPDLERWEEIRTVETGVGVCSPEVHYLKGSFWLTLGLEGGGTELVRFETDDLAVSPFQRARITLGGEDPSLFLDDDGAFYWVTGAGEVARLRENPLDGLAENKGQTMA